MGLVRVANPSGPGWADPETGSFDDTRPKGRDGRRYGPLPARWAHYRGLYQNGNRVIVSYTVGATAVLETPGFEVSGGVPIFTRTFEIGPRAGDLILQVAHLAGATGPLRHLNMADSHAVWFFGSDAGAREPEVIFDGHTGLEVARPDDFNMFGHDYSITAKIKTRRGGTLFAKTEPRGKWVPDGQAWFVRDGRLVFDIGWVGAVASRGRVDDGRWHEVAMTFEQSGSRVRLYIDGRLDGEGRLKAARERKGHVVRLGFAAPDFPEPRTYFDGQMEQVRFYDYAMSARELGAALTAHLVAWWPLDSVEAGRVSDASGGGHFASVRREPVRARDARFVAGGLSTGAGGFKWSASGGGDLRLTVPRGSETLRFTVRFCGASTEAEVRRGGESDFPRGGGASARSTQARRAAAVEWGCLDASQFWS